MSQRPPNYACNTATDSPPKPWMPWTRFSPYWIEYENSPKLYPTHKRIRIVQTSNARRPAKNTTKKACTGLMGCRSLSTAGSGSWSLVGEAGEEGWDVDGVEHGEGGWGATGGEVGVGGVCRSLRLSSGVVLPSYKTKAPAEFTGALLFRNW